MARFPGKRKRRRRAGAVPQRPRPALLADEPLAALRLAAGALRHPPVPGPRPRAGPGRRADRGRGGGDRRRARPGAGADRSDPASPSRSPTRTSTWRSSGCSARRSARSRASSTPAARATTRSPPTSRWSVGAASRRAMRLCAAAMERLLGLAEAHRDWPMPGYTHLQRAQPVYLGHHLLAYFWMLSRDARRFAFAAESASVMPLGSGALAGRQLADRRGRSSPPSSASPGSPRTRSTAPPTATSSSTT